MSARLRHRPRTGLTADAKARLRKAYVESDVPRAEIERRFGIAGATIVAIAKREGWPLRKAREQRAGT